VVTIKVLSLGSYAPMSPPKQTSKQFWNWFYGMAFRAAVALLQPSSVSPKCPISIFSLSLGIEKGPWGLDPVNREGLPEQLFVY
jgi:hypothetical protein